MADPVHAETDKLIAEMEKRINRVYRQAHKEIDAKCDDYFRRFLIKDKLKRDEMQAGIITAQEYADWRKGQLMVGDRWIRLRNQLAQDMHNTNVIARSVTEGYMPEVYAINHAYGTYQCEIGSGIDTSYTLYNREAVENILRDNPRLLPMPGKELSAKIAAGKDVLWNKQQIQSVMLQGILQGESIPEIAKRLRNEVSDTNRKASIRNARTMATTAENAGRLDAYKRAESKGIKLKKTWIATLDNRTRHAHRLLDGVTIPVNEPFISEFGEIMCPGDRSADPANLYNCFVADTKIASDSKIVRSYKHKYDGELITIKTATGVQFTCTPNHPILTPRGWIAAKCLKNGDYLLIANVSDNVFARRNPNIQHRFPSIDTVHKSIDMMGGKRTISMAVNFHGDVPTSDVEIIAEKRFLWSDWYPRIFDCFNKFRLKHTNKPLMSKSAFMKHFWSVSLTPFSLMCCAREALSFFFRCVSHSDIHSFRTITSGDSTFTKNTINNAPRKSKVISKLFNGRAVKITADKIVSIKTSLSLCHVYNLQTKNGYYFVNSSIPQNEEKVNGNFAIAHNCRCSMIAQIEGFERDTTANRLVGATHDDGTPMTYAEWKKAKPKSRDILHQEKVGNRMKAAYNKQYKERAKEARKKLSK